MRFLTLAAVGISSLLSFAAAQDLSQLPSCAVTCALNAIGATGCQATDAKCVCSATSFLSSVQTCISTACNATDQAATLAFAQQYCGSAGITITLPSASASAPPAASSSAPASSPAVVTSSAPAPSPPASSSAAPPASYTGAASPLKQQWAGVAGVVGLGVAAIL
ncbi:hypothetical protein H2200_013085 [Cladophialophora chaetospira]|uniref:CFEM domain-containing protein n=1 Tax=Cladophialophora chaetospira TaxID=386627 RepID=A0AA39CBT9_9EURO|nr:hypothetical protein H2200_013085 [Cladophialophora chaetospira]